MTQESVLRRKTRSAPPAPAVEEQPAPLFRLLPRTMVRVLSSATGLSVDAGAVSAHPTTPEEVPERLPEAAFVATLSRGMDDGAGGPGLVFCDAALHAGLIEALTIGRLAPRPPQPRRVTATDTALLGALFDRFLSSLAQAVQEAASASGALPGTAPDALSVEGWKVARPVIDPRLLAALLDEGSYCLIRTSVTLSSASGQRSGAFGLILPEGSRMQPDGSLAGRAGAPLKGERPGPAVRASPPASAPGKGGVAAEPDDERFAAAIRAQVMAAPACLNGILGRIRMPLTQVMALQVGDRLEMPLSQLETVEISGVDGHRQAEGRLGQARGMRALRLTRISDGVSLVASASLAGDTPAEDRFIPAGAGAGKL